LNKAHDIVVLQRKVLHGKNLLTYIISKPPGVMIIEKIRNCCLH